MIGNATDSRPCASEWGRVRRRSSRRCSLGGSFSDALHPSGQAPRTAGVSPAMAGKRARRPRSQAHSDFVKSIPIISAESAAALVKDGAVLLAGGFGMTGNPVHLLHALAARGTRNLTYIGNNVGE